MQNVENMTEDLDIDNAVRKTLDSIVQKFEIIADQSHIDDAVPTTLDTVKSKVDFINRKDKPISEQSNTDHQKGKTASQKLKVHHQKIIFP